MIAARLVVGPLGVNCFILGCEETKKGLIVDPGDDGELILAEVKRLGLEILFVVNTHGHFDHVGGNAFVLGKTAAKLLVHPADAPYLSRVATTASKYGVTGEDSPPPDGPLEEGGRITFGKVVAEIIHTPGHTPGGCSILIRNEGIVFTGDTLFAESVGRTDLPGGSQETLVDSIMTKLLILPEETVVWPGHGPDTTIGHEKRHNPYL